MAAALLRQFVRGLIGLRGGAVDKDAVLDVASSMAGLTPFQRDMLKARALAVLNRADGRADVPDVVRGASARVRSQAASLAEAMASVAEEVEALAEVAAPLAEEEETPALADEATPLAEEAEESTPLAEEERLLRELQQEALGGKPAPAPEAERVQTSVSQVSKGQKRGLGPLRPTLTPAPPVGMNGAASTSAVASVLSAMVLKGLEQVGADLCQVFIVEDEVHLTLRAESPAESGPVTGPRILSTRDGFTARVVGAGGPVVLESEQQLDGSETTWLERGLNALAAVSVGVPGDPGSGILVAGRTSMRRFGDDDLEQLASLASEVTLAIASADLVARAEELAVLKERMKLAREIHDGLASDLSAVVALFKYHEHRREVDPSDAESLLVQMRELVEQSLANARDILATLRPRQQIPRRLAEAVRRHVEDFSQTYGITAITRVLGTDDGLDEEERDRSSRCCGRR